MRKLIVNADDYGFSPAVSRGILEAHTRGIVTETTAMMVVEHAAPALEIALKDAPKLGLGVHLTATAGHALTDAVGLVDENGAFLTREHWPAVFPLITFETIYAEFSAQIEKFKQVTGQKPSHLDSHHHCAYILPHGMRATLQLAQEYNVPVRNVGMTGDGQTNPDDLRSVLSWNWPEDQIELPFQDAIQAIQDMPPRTTDVFESRFFDDTVYLGNILNILANLPEDKTVEMMCHPGYVDEFLLDPYQAPRESEIEMLTHRSVRELIQSENIQLITYTEL